MLSRKIVRKVIRSDATKLRYERESQPFPRISAEVESMKGPQQTDQAALFYEFSLERHVPASHLLRSIDRLVDLSGVRSELALSTVRPAGHRLILNCSCGCCWSATATASLRTPVA